MGTRKEQGRTLKLAEGRGVRFLGNFPANVGGSAKRFWVLQYSGGTGRPWSGVLVINGVLMKMKLKRICPRTNIIEVVFPLL